MGFDIRYVEWACLTSRDVFDDRVVYDEGAKMMDEGKEFMCVCFLSLAFRSIPLMLRFFFILWEFWECFVFYLFVYLHFFIRYQIVYIAE